MFLVMRVTSVEHYDVVPFVGLFQTCVLLLDLILFQITAAAAAAGGGGGGGGGGGFFPRSLAGSLGRLFDHSFPGCALVLLLLLFLFLFFLRLYRAH